MTERMIFKVQRPVNVGAPPHIYVYSECKGFRFLGEDSKIFNMFQPEENKFFCYGRIVSDKIHLEERAPWQIW